MGMEIERKWIPDRTWSEKMIRKYKGSEIEQAYLCFEPVIRVRRDGQAYYMTYKGQGVMEHTEYNLPLNKKAYEELLPKCEGSILSKERFRIPFSAEFPYDPAGRIKGPDGALVIELDVFHGKLEGLQLLEVEFENREDAERFPAPAVFGEDVTGNKEYTNAYMARKA